MMYFAVIFTLVFDLLLIGTVFNAQEISGMGVIFFANIMSVYVIFSKNYSQAK